jgi:maltose alpha-D-glucosyltransferase / alpha-amylase
MLQDLWYKHSVIYNLDVDIFMDANGDGVGDFEGLIRKIEYLNSLDVNVVWIAPFQPSPMRDNGYDVADYYGVDPRYGSLGDFVEFLHAADNRGIKVIMDLVVNHTSDQHRWFQSARKGKDAPYHDWYVWADDPPEHLKRDNVFPEYVDGTWTYDEKAQAHYFHHFFPFQPELNMDNPDVRTEVRRIIGFWLQLNVHGFRMDAVPFLLESLDLEEKKEIKKFEYLHDIRDFLQWRQGSAIMLGEVNVPPAEAVEYFGNEKGVLHMMFNFHVNQHLFYAMASGEVNTLIDALHATKELPPYAQWAHFLRNHDELNLNQLTEKQRQRVFAEFGPEEEMQIFGRGIRRRLASMLGGDRRRIELAYSMLFALPGTPVLYYGEEIGMGEDLSLEERNAVRTPMQWANEPQASFSTAGETCRPVIKEGPFGYEKVNVEDQRRDPCSLLNWMAHMIRLHQESPEIGFGDWEILETGSPSVLALRYDWGGNSLLTVHNFSHEEQQVQVDPGVEEGKTLVNLLVAERLEAGKSGKHKLTLNPYGYQWYRVGDLQHILKRQRD